MPLCVAGWCVQSDDEDSRSRWKPTRNNTTAVQRKRLDWAVSTSPAKACAMAMSGILVSVAQLLMSFA